MSKIEVAPQVKVTLYYWPIVNIIDTKSSGIAGHVACNVQEIGGSGRSLYVSTNFFLEGTSPRKDRSRLLPDIIKSGKIMPSDKALSLELNIFTKDVIKIELPPSKTSFDDFVNTFKESAKNILTEGHDNFTRNCAHLASLVLEAIYGIKHRDDYVLLPKTVALDACSYLDSISNRQKEKENNVEKLKDLSGWFGKDKTEILPEDEAVTIISKYRFASAMLYGIPEQIVNIVEEKDKLEVKKSFEEFIKALGEKKPDDRKVAKEFVHLRKVINIAEKNVEKEYKSFFQSLLVRFYALVRIIISDEKLEPLRKLRSLLDEIESSIPALSKKTNQPQPPPEEEQRIKKTN